MEKSKKKISDKNWRHSRSICKACALAALAVLFIWAGGQFMAGALQVFGKNPVTFSTYLSVFVFVLISAWINGLGRFWNRRGLRHGVNLLLLAGALVLSGVRIYRQTEQLLQEWQYVLNQYLALVDKYYHTSYASYSGGAGQADFFIQIGVFVIFAVLQTIAAERRKPVWLGLFPACMLSGMLLVGFSPDFPELAVFVGGLVLCVSPVWKSREKFRRLGMTAGAVILVFAVSALCFSGTAQNMAARKQDMLAVQKQMERQVISFFKAGTDIGKGVVGNDFPEYTNEEMMVLTAEQKPEQSVYLRGTDRDTYRNGVWSSNSDVEACQDEVIQYEGCEDIHIPAAVANECYLACSDHLSGAKPLHYIVSYTGMNDTLAYLPYGADTDTIDGITRISGDYEIRKTRFSDQISAQVWGMDSFLNRMFLQSGTQGWPGEKLSEYQAFYEFYNDYVKENYLDVPEEISIVKDIVETWNQTGQMNEEELQSQDSAALNQARYAAALLVQEFLTDNYRYWKNLKDSGTEDPIVYFLSESKEGFCVHFASAGVLLLRESGVPARYVSGFHVPKNSFVKNEDGTYSSSVADLRAHAWAEIYLENYGWTPVEMTPGYSTYDSTDVMEAPDVDTEADEGRNPETDAERQDEPTDGETDADRQEEPADSDADARMPDNVGNGQETDDEAGPDAMTSTGGTVDGVNLKRILQYTWIAGGCAAACAAVLLWRRRKSVLWKQLLHTDLRHRRYSRAVRRINRHLYRTLMHGKASAHRQITDREYLELLKQNYPEEDWETYMQIVQKASYSAEELEMEEFSIIREMAEKIISLHLGEKFVIL